MKAKKTMIFIRYENRRSEVVKAVDFMQAFDECLGPTSQDLLLEDNILSGVKFLNSMWSHEVKDADLYMYKGAYDVGIIWQ